MDRKSIIKKIIEKNRETIITPKLREQQMISFAAGNTFDVFTKEERLTKELVKQTIYRNKTY